MPDRSLGEALHRNSRLDAQDPIHAFTAFHARIESFPEQQSQLIDFAGQFGLTDASGAAALFCAGLHPAREPASLLPHEMMALFYAMRHVDSAERDASDAALTSTNAGNRRERMENLPGEIGSACERCGSAIDSLTSLGRTVPFCPRDQPLTPRRRVELIPQELRTGGRAVDLRDELPNLIFCLVGPPSAGKTTLARMMASIVPFIRLVPIVKTRRPRPGEFDGVDAFYIAPDVFARLAASGEFVISGQYYGNPFGVVGELLVRTLLDGDDAVLVISPEGAQQLKGRYANTCIIGVVPPSLEVLLDRIVTRADYSEQERGTRAERVRDGLPPLVDCDFMIVTESLDQSLHRIFDVIYDVRCQAGRGRRRHDDVRE